MDIEKQEQGERDRRIPCPHTRIIRQYKDKLLCLDCGKVEQ